VLSASEAREGAKVAREETKARKQAEQQAADRQALVDAMRRLQAPDSKNGIRDVAGLGHGQRFEKTWGALVADGTVVRDGTIVKANNQAYDAYRLSLSNMQEDFEP
jgi:hypothetical protein